MSRFLFPTSLAIAALAGCAAAPQTAPAVDEAQASVDRQIADAGQRIQRSQAELFQAAALSAPVAAPPADIRDDGQPVTLAWQGDAAELLQSLAKARGLAFTTAGVKLPLPVSLSVKDEPFRGVLQLLRAQIGYRAAVRQEGERIVLTYGRPQP